MNDAELTVDLIEVIASESSFDECVTFLSINSYYYSILLNNDFWKQRAKRLYDVESFRPVDWRKFEHALLKKNGDIFETFHLGCEIGFLNLVSALIDHQKIDLNNKHAYGLKIAITKGHHQIVDALINYSSNEFLQHKILQEATQLIQACGTSNIKEVLQDYFAKNFNIGSEVVDTILVEFSEIRIHESSEIILRAALILGMIAKWYRGGFNNKIINLKAYPTLLSDAFHARHLEIVKVLLASKDTVYEQKASLSNITTDHLIAAYSTGHIEMVELICSDPRAPPEALNLYTLIRNIKS